MANCLLGKWKPSHGTNYQYVLKSHIKLEKKVLTNFSYQNIWLLQTLQLSAPK